MPITYRPPKSQLWGHRVGRLSPLQLHGLLERFLGEQALVVDRPNLDLTVICEPSDSDPISRALDGLPPDAGGAGEDRRGDDFFGTAWRRISRKLPPDSLRAAVEWVEAIDPHLNHRRGLIPAVLLHQHVSFRWRDGLGQGEAAAPLPPSTIGIHYGRPRVFSTDFRLESVRHYYAVKQSLRDLDLVTLSDKHVRPKGAIGKVL